MNRRRWIWILAGLLGLGVGYLITVPGCHSGQAFLLNSSSIGTSEIILRMGGEVLWRGRLPWFQARWITFRLPESGDAIIEVSFEDGSRYIEPGLYLMTPSRATHLLIVRDARIDIIDFRNSPPLEIDPESWVGRAWAYVHFLGVAASCPIRAMIPPFP